MNESPKKRFQQTAHAKTWNDVVDSHQFVAASDAALLEFNTKLGTPCDMGTAAAQEWRRQGARDFLFILNNLTTTEKPITKSVVGNLKQGV